MNFITHLALHKVITDNSEWCDSHGMMYVSRALADRSDSARVHVAVDWIWVPSGNLTVRGVIACYWTLVIGADDTKS